MKQIEAIFAVDCMEAANPALASSFSPSGASVTATGTTSLTAPNFPKLTCNATFKGTVNADGTATITSATFTGGALGACALVKLATPFTLTATSTTTVVATGIQVTTPVSCGPDTLNATWTNGSPSHFNIPTGSINPGGCTATAALTVSGVTII